MQHFIENTRKWVRIFSTFTAILSIQLMRMETNPILKALLRIIRLLENQQNNGTPAMSTLNTPEILPDLIDSVDVKAILKISDRTLSRLKKNHVLKYVRIGRRDYFSKSDIQNLTLFFLK